MHPTTRDASQPLRPAPHVALHSTRAHRPSLSSPTSTTQVCGSSRAHGWRAKAGPVVIVLGTIYVMFQLATRAASLPVPAAAACIDFHRKELERQRDLLRRVWDIGGEHEEVLDVHEPQTLEGTDDRVGGLSTEVWAKRQERVVLPEWGFAKDARQARARHALARQRVLAEDGPKFRRHLDERHHASGNAPAYRARDVCVA
jgi:hypothetical protein